MFFMFFILKSMFFTSMIKFTHRPKIRVFAPQGRLVAPIHIKLGRTDGH